MRIIVPDFDATQEVDPVLLKMELEFERAERAVKSTDDADVKKKLKVILKDMKKAKASYEKTGDKKPSFTIGYIPAAKKTTATNMAIKAGAESDFVKLADQSIDADRLVVKFGLRGWDLSIPFESEDEWVCGNKVKAASSMVLEVVEHNDLLRGLARAILKLNELTEAEKKR